MTFHVTVRGVDRRVVFSDDEDRWLFVRLLREAVGRAGWRVYAWCLMDNHFHLLMLDPGGLLSTGMQWLNGRYAQRFNRRHGRTGPLWEGRFHSARISDERHLLEAARYIALNPVRAGLVDRPDDWEWSSHRGHLGLQFPLVADDALLELLGRTPDAAREAYRGLVEEAVRRRAA